MILKNISELREFIRQYNSTSVLKVGANKCWQNWETWNTKYSNPLNWLQGNVERNYTIRIMLLASSSNPHRHGDISVDEFNKLINAYHNLNDHTISDKRILNDEAEILLCSIKKWESDNNKKVRNLSLKLSDVLNPELIRSHGASLFAQRAGSFQNSGFGYPFAHIQRTIKFIELLSQYSEGNLSDNFFNYQNLNKLDYFRLFLTCFSIFGYFYSKEGCGFCNLSKLPNIDNNLQKSGITHENIQIFINQNSMLFTSKEDHTFRNKVNKTIDNVPTFYQPFLYNYFLEFPLINLDNEKFCLPDPISFIESCWNQIGEIIFKSGSIRREVLSSVFEDYIESVLLPFIAPHSFKRISEVTNPNSNKDKRADFLIETSSSYIVLECKNSIMCADTSAYYQPDKMADIYYRIHFAIEQISVTVDALKLHDKPVIPLVLTFYDSIAAANVFQEMIRATDYCSCLGLNVIPVVYSLHEFEHWISNRSLDNWVELILAKQTGDPPIQPDNKGHNYGHLSNISF